MSYPNLIKVMNPSTQSMWVLGQKEDLKFVVQETSIWNIKLFKAL